MANSTRGHICVWLSLNNAYQARHCVFNHCTKTAAAAAQPVSQLQPRPHIELLQLIHKCLEIVNITHVQSGQRTLDTGQIGLIAGPIPCQNPPGNVRLHARPSTQDRRSGVKKRSNAKCGLNKWLANFPSAQSPIPFPVLLQDTRKLY